MIITLFFRDVNDIDLYTGLLSEIPLNGSILGPTITCLILDQFVRIKHGDRFWYENKGLHGFSPKQLDELRKTSLAQIICDNSDDLDIIQPRVMESIGENNTYVSCSEIECPDLQYWKEDLHILKLSKNLNYTNVLDDS